MLSPDVTGNSILRVLPPGERERLHSFMTIIHLRQNDLVYAQNAVIDSVYFVESGLVSLVKVGDARTAIEVGIVGREGLLGAEVVLGSRRSTVQAIVQLDGQAFRMPAAAFTQMCAAAPALTSYAANYISFSIFQAQQNAFCYATHTVEERLCRWILQAQDFTQMDTLDLTQEVLSHTLGVQRTTLSTVAHSFQEAGFIRYSRGKIQIVDRLGLEQAACACSGLLRRQVAAVTHRETTN
jgi:CRP-like cAMP-binding protein